MDRETRAKAMLRTIIKASRSREASETAARALECQTSAHAATLARVEGFASRSRTAGRDKAGAHGWVEEGAHIANHSVRLEREIAEHLRRFIVLDPGCDGGLSGGSGGRVWKEDTDQLCAQLRDIRDLQRTVALRLRGGASAADARESGAVMSDLLLQVRRSVGDKLAALAEEESAAAEGLTDLRHEARHAPPPLPPLTRAGARPRSGGGCTLSASCIRLGDTTSA